MLIFVLFGQRKCSYEGQYAPEALSCIDEIGYGDNPDYLTSEQERYELTGEFASLKIITLTLDGTAVKNALCPPPPIISATFES